MCVCVCVLELGGLGVDLGGIRGKNDQNTLYKILKELMVILCKKCLSQIKWTWVFIYA